MESESPELLILQRRKSPSTPCDQSMNEVVTDEVTSPSFTPQKEELKELTGGFRRKAAAPKRVAEFKDLRSELVRYVPKSLPRRANPSLSRKSWTTKTRGPKQSMRLSGSRHHEFGLRGQGD